MKDKLPLAPSLRREEVNQPSRALLAAVVLVLGFGFTASALMNTADETPAPAPAHDTVAPTIREAAAPATLVGGPAELPEVAAAVRDWTWESREPRPSAATYDPEELWLPR